MKRIFILLAMFAASAATTLSAQSLGGPLTLTIDGIRSNNGKIMIGLGDRTVPQSMVGRIVASDTTGVACVIDSLPLGVQKLYIFHDENGNHKLELGTNGIPTEGVGMDNQKSWEPSVTITDKPQTIQLHIVYLPLKKQPQWKTNN